LLLIAVQEYIKRIPHLNCVSGVVVHKVDETPEYGTPLLTLSTCSYHRNDGAGREVVVCYLEKEFDKNGNSVKRTLSI
jgi:hypothetical protein